MNGEDREQMVELLSVEGKKQIVDIGDLIKAACSMVIGKVGVPIKAIVATADLNTNLFSETTSSYLVAVL